MTVVIALRDDDRVYIGADCCGGNYRDIRRRKDTKVFRTGDYLIGVVGNYRVGQIIRYSKELPAPPEKVNHRFMCTKFTDAVKDILFSHGYARKVGGVRKTSPMLVAVGGQLFHMEENFEIAELVNGYTALGSGEDYALGALFATEDNWYDGRKRMRCALRAAEEHCRTVTGPFTILSQKIPGD